MRDHYEEELRKVVKKVAFGWRARKRKTSALRREPRSIGEHLGSKMLNDKVVGLIRKFLMNTRSRRKRRGSERNSVVYAGVWWVY